jgi:hypothetical protein
MMSIEAISELDAERTVINVLLQGQERQCDQLDRDYQAARRALRAQVDQLRRHRDALSTRLAAVQAA